MLQKPYGIIRAKHTVVFQCICVMMAWIFSRIRGTCRNIVTIKADALSKSPGWCSKDESAVQNKTKKKKEKEHTQRQQEEQEQELQEQEQELQEQEQEQEQEQVLSKRRRRSTQRRKREKKEKEVTTSDVVF